MQSPGIVIKPTNSFSYLSMLPLAVPPTQTQTQSDSQSHSQSHFHQPEAEAEQQNYNQNGNLVMRSSGIGNDNFPIITPNYDRSLIKKGIIHFGVGGFHRSHLAYYMDNLLHQSAKEESCRYWGICGVGVREDDRRISEAMKAQNCYYTLVSRGSKPEQLEIRIVGSILDYLFVPDEPNKVKKQLLSTETKIITLTITEGGYEFAHNPEIREDIENYHNFNISSWSNSSSSSSSPSIHYPRSVFGWIVSAIDARHRLGMEPFTVCSCDNLLQNGSVTKECLLNFAKGIGNPDLISYINDGIICPNSMVDRITPVTKPADIEFIKQKYGINDKWPIVCEDWVQWVIEEKEGFFRLGKPPFHLLTGDKYNILLVEDVNPFENMKLRLLNASHSAICYLGFLSGYSYINEIMRDPDFAAYVRRFMDREVTPGLPPVPKLNLEDYKTKLIERFANPFIKDTTLRVCMDGANKMPKFLFPTLRYQLTDSKGSFSIHYSSLMLAAWFRFLLGKTDDGQPIPLQDSLAIKLGLAEVAQRSRGDARALFNAARSVFQELSDNELLIQHVQKALDMLYLIKAKETLKRWLELE